MRLCPICLLLSVVLLFSACIKNEQDQNAPSLVLLAVNDGQTVNSGSFVSFRVNCSDDVNLAFVRVEATCPLSNWNATTDPDNARQEYPTLGETLELSSAFQLIEDLHSETCSLSVTCVDADGNESNSDSFFFDVRNVFDSAGPTIELEDSIENIEGLVISPGSFSLTGTVTDDSGIDYVSVEIFDGTGTISIKEEDYSSPTIVSLSDIDIFFPSSSPLGDYKLRVAAIDGLNNYRERVFNLVVQ